MNDNLFAETLANLRHEAMLIHPYGLDISQILGNSGDPAGYPNPGAAVTAGTSTALSHTTLLPGRGWNVHAASATITSDLAVAGWLQDSGFITTLEPALVNGVGGPFGEQFERRIPFILAAGVPATIPLGVVLRDFRQIQITVRPSTAVRPRIAVAYDAFRVWGDDVYSAERVIGLYGNSNGHSMQENARNVEHWPNLFASSLRASGQSVRIANGSFGGSNAAAMAATLRTGMHANVRLSAAIIMLGGNDTPGAAFQADMLAIVDIIRQRNPGIPVTVLTMSPSRNAVREAKRFAITADQTAVVAARPGVTLMDISDAYPAGDLTMYANSGVDEIHYSKLGARRVTERVLSRLAETTQLGVRTASYLAPATYVAP